MDAQTIVEKRQKLDWSQEKLAEKMGVTRTTISNWEREEVKLSIPVQKALKVLFEEHGA